MRNNLGDFARLSHVIEAIDEIDNYLGDIGFNSFEENSMMRFACIKQLEIIGEASKHITVEIKNKFSDIEWKQIIGLRNIFVHEYFGIDIKLVWDIIIHDLPFLKSKIQIIIDELKS